ncbi:SWIM-type domain-containing protein [Mycena indigotica]|uniref:SWIM-type domain-containing protein n=1 Tax=Mycena indigotica TaxID=2126181 RepID=A0A8H6SCR4_9AGAR|nr:SWIM-type domain-containing protein [Mycena indigotica]KAF7297058.1 SWIM-type domain-containing protein [Mycena indigotica]
MSPERRSTISGAKKWRHSISGTIISSNLRRLLLSELAHLGVDVLEPVGVPPDVEILAWGMRKIAQPLRDTVQEIAMDATYNTNSRNLELYAVMGELDNAGFPLAYCLMSTATSISQGKRKNTLAAFLSCVKAQYGIQPKFTHVDKDLGEIAALKLVWPQAKTSICWWHVNDAVGKRIRMTKLATTKYKPQPGKPDKEEYEGGRPEDVSEDEDEPELPTPTHNPSRLTVRLPIRQPSPPRRLDASGIPVIRIQPGPFIYDSSDDSSDAAIETDDEDDTSESEVTQLLGKRKRKSPKRLFCPPEQQAPLIEMMKQHSHAHPLIPGFCHPSADGIRYWAVKQMYDFCVAHDLREAWAYLWGNWYRSGRWEIWVRSAHPMIPRLRTTMICESHWRKLKQEYLHEFHCPRLDLLVWVLVTKLCPPYYDKLVKLTTYLGRTRISELPSWRGTLLSVWRKLEGRDVSDRVQDGYRPDVRRWVCSCPSYATSRFLICKHLIRLVKRVSTRFFREVQRQRTTPFWQHPDLVPVDGDGQTPDVTQEEGPRDWEVPDDEDDEGPLGAGPYAETEADREFEASAATFEAEFDDEIALLESFVAGLKHQRQFRDPKMLEVLRKKGGKGILFRLPLSLNGIICATSCSSFARCPGSFGMVHPPVAHPWIIPASTSSIDVKLDFGKDGDEGITVKTW